MIDKIKSIIVLPVPPRYTVSQVGYLQVNAQDKILVIYDDKGNRKVVSASDSSITSSVINNLIDNKLKNIQVLKYKGIKETYADLLAEQNKQIGDVWQVKEQNKQYIWNGENWVEIGFDFDLNKIYTTIAITSGILRDTKADKADTLSGYNIQDAYTKIETQNLIDNTSSFLNMNKADKTDTLSGYNIQDAYTKIETQNLIDNTSSFLNMNKADKADTLSGYTIQDAYTKIEIQNLLNNKQNIINNDNKINYTLLSGFNLYISGHVNNPLTGQICYFYVNELSTLYYGTTDKISVSDNAFKVNIGIGNTVEKLLAYAHGKNNKALGRYSIADGYGTTTIGDAAFSQGMTTIASGNYSHAEGGNTIANGSTSHAEGQKSQSIGNYTHAEGNDTKAIGLYSHAEGTTTITSGNASHTQGTGTVANGNCSHAQGHSTKANGQDSHAEGLGSETNGNCSHAEGRYTITNSNFSHAEGNYTIAAQLYQHVEGQWNTPLTGYQHIVGAGDGGESGQPSNIRKNIQTLDWSGNLWNAGNVTANDFIINENLKLSMLSGKAETSDVQYISSIIGDASVLGNDTLVSTLQYFGDVLYNEIDERQQVENQLSSAITGKVDKLSGYSLMKDSEITRLASVDNYNDTTVKNNINTISGTYLKNININGTEGIKTNNIANVTLPTCTPLPQEFYASTTLDICNNIESNYDACTPGMLYLAEFGKHGEMTDLPHGINNSEVIIRIVSRNVYVLQMFSTDTYTNHWYAMYYGDMTTAEGNTTPWRGILSLPNNGTTQLDYTPINNYDATTKKYVDEQISAKLTTTNATVANVQEIVSSYISSYVKTEVDPKFTTTSGQFVTKTELPGLVSSLISGYVNELKETKALALALSSILVENDQSNAAKIQQQIDNSLELNY